MDADVGYHTEFDTMIQPLDVIISIVYRRELSFEIPEFFNKYKEISLQHQPALEELEVLIKKSISRILTLFSKPYMNKLHQILNDDGIIYYIYTNLFSLIVNDIESLLSSMQAK